jgi:hypothetical protein
MVLLNDGTLAFAAGTDPTKHTLGTCSISYRNSENPAYLKVTYKDNTLTVSSSVYLFIKDVIFN